MQSDPLRRGDSVPLHVCLATIPPTSAKSASRQPFWFRLIPSRKVSQMIRVLRGCASLAIVVGTLSLNGLTPASAGDWLRFRGPNGAGVSLDDKAPPVEWSETKNMKWKFELPGPGLSCPIVVGNKVIVTCWSGYGTTTARDAKQDQLKRHLVCVDRQTGKKATTMRGTNGQSAPNCSRLSRLHRRITSGGKSGRRSR